MTGAGGSLCTEYQEHGLESGSKGDSKLMNENAPASASGEDVLLNPVAIKEDIDDKAYYIHLGELNTNGSAGGLNLEGDKIDRSRDSCRK